MLRNPGKNLAVVVCFDVLGRKNKLKIHTIGRLLAITVKVLLMNERRLVFFFPPSVSAQLTEKILPIDRANDGKFICCSSHTKASQKAFHEHMILPSSA